MRTRKEINDEYTHCAMVSGDLAYRRDITFTNEIKRLQGRMLELNHEKGSDDPQPETKAPENPPVDAHPKAEVKIVTGNSEAVVH